MEKTSAEQAKSKSPPFGGGVRVFCYDRGRLRLLAWFVFLGDMMLIIKIIAVRS